VVAWLFSAAACFALTGLGVGLAGLFPRFVYENPAHRASVWALILGFVFASSYLVLTGMIAGIGYLLVIRGLADTAPVLAGGIAIFCAMSLFTGIVPVALATRRLRNYAWEF
jgi:asparagine N-glycosylation enzyme membrane subunit Stt3